MLTYFSRESLFAKHDVTNFLRIATPLSRSPNTVSSLYAGICLATTRDKTSSSVSLEGPSYKLSQVQLNTKLMITTHF